MVICSPLRLLFVEVIVTLTVAESIVPNSVIFQRRLDTNVQHTKRVMPLLLVKNEAIAGVKLLHNPVFGGFLLVFYR